jgi:iron only hydrogenase large subunit-like protein
VQDARRVKTVCVMPCYDKKLEAVRPNFSLEETPSVVKEVDTVLATHELLDLFKHVSEPSSS